MHEEEAFGVPIEPTRNATPPKTLSPGGGKGASRPGSYTHQLTGSLIQSGGGDGMALPSPPDQDSSSPRQPRTASRLPATPAEPPPSSEDIAATGFTPTLSGTGSPSAARFDTATRQTGPVRFSAAASSTPASHPVSRAKTAPGSPSPDPVPRNDSPAPAASPEELPFSTAEPLNQLYQTDKPVPRPDRAGPVPYAGQATCQADLAASRQRIKANERKLLALLGPGSPAASGQPASAGNPFFNRIGETEWQATHDTAHAVLNVLRQTKIEPRVVNAVINLFNAAYQQETAAMEGLAQGTFSAAKLGEQVNDAYREGTVGFENIPQGTFSAAKLGEQLNDTYREGTVGMEGLAKGTFSAATLGEQLNDTYREGTVGMEHVPEGSFSLKTAGEQIVDHLHDGTTPLGQQTDEAARLWADLRDTVYGEQVSNQMGSAHIGMINLSESMVKTAIVLLATALPPDTAMEQFRSQYADSLYDAGALAEQLRRPFAVADALQDQVSDLAREGRQAYRSIQSPDFDTREWLTTDPMKAIYTHPDRFTGFCLEELLPALLTTRGLEKLGLASKVSNTVQFGVKGYWVGYQSYAKAYEATRERYRDHPEVLQTDPAYQRYLRESEGKEAERRQAYIEAKARQGGVTAAILGVTTYLVMNKFQDATRTGEEGRGVLMMQQLLKSIGMSVTKEVAQASKEANRNAIEKGKLP